MKKLILLLVIAILSTINIYGQAIPQQISYQGVLRLANGNIVGDGNYQLTFKIYNTLSGGTALWSEAQTVMVTNGVFSAHLGSITPITGVAFNRDHYLGITIAAEPELSPRTKLTPTPYSFMAMDIMDNTVTSSKITNLTITGSDIANNTIGPEKLNFTPGTGTIGGSGTANYLPLFTNANTLGNSKLFQNTNGDLQIGSDGVRTQLTLSANDNVNEGGQINWNGSGSFDDWYQDIYLNEMRIRTNSANDDLVNIFNGGSGKTNIRVEAEIQTQPTSDANIVPIAYANVNSDGTIRTDASTGNVTLSSHSAGTGNYYFTITGWNVSYLTTVCVATIVGSDGGEINWSSSGGGAVLAIFTRSSTGTAQDKPFTFVVYKK